MRGWGVCVLLDGNGVFDKRLEKEEQGPRDREWGLGDQKTRRRDRDPNRPGTSQRCGRKGWDWETNT